MLIKTSQVMHGIGASLCENFCFSAHTKKPREELAFNEMCARCFEAWGQLGAACEVGQGGRPERRFFITLHSGLLW